MNKRRRPALQVAACATLEVAGAEGPLAARLYSHGGTRKKRDRLMVFFHGGGFVGGDLDEARPVPAPPGRRSPQLRWCWRRATRWPPNSPFPAAVEDAHAVLLWAKKNKAKLGWTGKQLVVAGIEAGANLAAVCALMSRDRGAPEAGRPDPDHADARPGPVHLLDARSAARRRDAGEVADSCAASYRGYLPNAADRSHPYASPLQSSRLKNLPPALILSAEDDPLRDEAEQYGAKLASCGVSTTVKRLAPAPCRMPPPATSAPARQSALTEIAASWQRSTDSSDQPT